MSSSVKADPVASASGVVKSKKSVKFQQKTIRKRNCSPESEGLLKLVPEPNRQTITAPEYDDDDAEVDQEQKELEKGSKKKSKGKGSKKKLDDDDDDVQETPPGEWEVERIVDIATDTHDRILFRCRWTGFNAEDDTWERKDHITNASALLRDFCEAQTMLIRGNLAEGLLQPVVKAINRCLTKKQPDPCLLLRLVGHNVNEKTSSHGVSMGQAVKKLRNALAAAKVTFNPDGKMQINANSYASDMDGMIDISSFLSIPPWDLYDVALLYLSRRQKRTCSRLKEYANKLSEEMSESKNCPTEIKVENLLDSEVPLEFEYLVEYDLNNNNDAKPPDEFLQCTCVGVCGKSCACNHENKMIPPFKMTKTTATLRCGSRQPVYLCTKLCSCKCLVKETTVTPPIPFTIFRTKNRGWGLRARKEIRKGQLVTTYLGQLLNETQRIARQNSQSEATDTFLFDLDYHSDTPTYSIDARFKGNEARFINHSCNPNLSINPIYCDYRNVQCPILGFFANDTIEAGRELTIDYNAITIKEYVIPPHMMELRKQQNKKKSSYMGGGHRRKARSLLSTGDEEVGVSPPKRLKPSESVDGQEEEDDDEDVNDYLTVQDEGEEGDNFTTGQLNPCECGSSICRGFIF